jgi:long-chain acyl-CoA synthetase
VTQTSDASTPATVSDGVLLADLDASIACGMAIAYWARRQPDAVAIVSEHGNRTFGELDAGANRLANALRAGGLQPGDGVALVCGNRPEFVEVWAACIRSGLRFTPVNFHLTGGEAGYIVRDCGARVLLADEPRRAVALEALAQAGTACRGVAIGGEIDGFERYADVLASASPVLGFAPEAGGSMLYTSGTTGNPKGVHHRPAPIRIPNIAGYAPGDANLCTGPLYHAAPLNISLIAAISHGATVVLMDQWDAAATLELVERHHITHTHMVPTMFHRLLALPDAVRTAHDTSSLRLVVHGAAPCPVHVKQGIIEWFGPIVVEYYAATEGTGTLVDATTWLAKPGTVGKPYPRGKVIVGDDAANPLPANEVGAVWLHAPGDEGFEYLGDPDKTSSSFRGDYFTLGDVGYLDDDGFLFLTDRTANLIISGGVNIYPAEVDAVLLAHPAVGDAAVIGVPDDEWGESVLAVVEPREGVEGSDALAAELLEHCRASLAHYKCPRRVEFVTELPRHDNGKIYKRKLREQHR